MKPVRFILHSDSLRAALRAVARWTPTAVGVSIVYFPFSVYLPTERCPPEQSIVQPCQRLPCGSISNAGLGQLKDLLRPPDSGLRIAVVFAGERHGGNPVVMRRNFAQHQLQNVHRGTLSACLQYGVALRREECRPHRQRISGEQKRVCGVNCSPCAEICRSGYGNTVLLLIIAHGSGSLCIPDAVRHERCSAALSLLNTPQKGLQIENMAAFLCVGVQSRCLLSNGIAGVLSLR